MSLAEVEAMACKYPTFFFFFSSVQTVLDLFLEIVRDDEVLCPCCNQVSE